MDQSTFPVRLVKGGVSFIGDKGRASFASDRVMFTHAEQIVFSFSREDIKRMRKNPFTGVWHVKLRDERKVSVKGLSPSKSKFNQRMHHFGHSDAPTSIF